MAPASIVRRYLGEGCSRINRKDVSQTAHSLPLDPMPDEDPADSVDTTLVMLFDAFLSPQGALNGAVVTSLDLGDECLPRNARRHLRMYDAHSSTSCFNL